MCHKPLFISTAFRFSEKTSQLTGQKPTDEVTMTSLISKQRASGELLNHILEQEELPAVIQNLDGSVLTQLIRHVGLEDSAQIVSLATAEQLKSVLDEDLWHDEGPGRDETFDAERFGLWLDIMMENGSDFAVGKVRELDEDLLTLGLCRLVWVVDLHHLSMGLHDDRQPGMGRALEGLLDGTFHQGFDHYVAVAKDESSWDSVCALMAALNESDYEMLTRLLNRCSWISGECIEDNGDLYHVFTAGEMLEEDVSSERKERKEREGFVTPTSAAVFLDQARSTPLVEMIAAETMDPVSGAYFRAMEAETAPDFNSRKVEGSSEKGASSAVNPKVLVLVETLQKALAPPAFHQKLLAHDKAEPWDHPLPLVVAMGLIRQTDPDLFSHRMKEISYLSNTLISGCGYKGRTFQPKEAAEAAFSVCNLGGEYLLEGHGESRGDLSVDPWTAILEVHHLVKLFQVGWKILFDDVVAHTAGVLLEFFLQQEHGMTGSQRVYQMTQKIILLRFCIASGRPWEFKDQMDDLHPFWEDETAAAIADLLQPYPILSEVICRKEDHRLFPFIGSQVHIGAVHDFLRDAL